MSERARLFALLAAVYGFLVFLGTCAIGVRGLRPDCVATRSLPANRRLVSDDVDCRDAKTPFAGKYLSARRGRGDRVETGLLRDAPMVWAKDHTVVVPVPLTPVQAKLVNARTMLDVRWQHTRYTGPVIAVVADGAQATALVRIAEADMKEKMFEKDAAVYVLGERSR
ncbi:MAG TPA: hypothetical protein VGR02_15345 [Thermoanaerobaculia bacterium]|jgi:hypothetical protein|nr:hypothetical protein [Thermoanaerobaculia bacterium]